MTFGGTQVDREALEALALSEREYEAIVERLGREPNTLELGLFGSLWSEHCGYKHSKPLLSMFSFRSSRILVEQGSENAGVVDIGGGLAVVFKIESHNHPSAVEPYEGAATGVGGIVRDIFAMGARPIALLNSLRFGPPTEDRNRYLFGGVVAGISGYGNCIGVPNVGGEVVFSESYSGNPLVNAMCIGLLRVDEMVRSTTGGPGNLLMLVGADTGRDGIHGASALASRTFEEDREMRPTVQVGNPFLEKVLIEACLEAARLDCVVGVQDLGAAGLTSSAVEAAANAGSGIEIDVSLVPRRDVDMDPYEVMLSESQERMLFVVREGGEAEVRQVFEKWDLDSTVIGRVTDDGLVRILENGRVQGEAPVRLLTDAPRYRIEGVKPPWLAEAPGSRHGRRTAPPALPQRRAAGAHGVAQHREQGVGLPPVRPPGADEYAGGSRWRRRRAADQRRWTKALAAATDGNGRYCHLDPYVGGMIAVAEACRNVSCTGASPIALTDCLNFGNPERPDVYYQLEQCVAGMARASEALEAPVVSGNVSLYNESRGAGIYPTPIVGCVGLLDDAGLHVGSGFQREGDVVVLLGRSEVHGEASELGGSEYLERVHSLVAGRPSIDIEIEAAVQRACRRLAAARVSRSAHDCSDGGLAVALAESCVTGGVGFAGDLPVTGRWDAALFGEGQSRIVVSVAPADVGVVERVCREEGVSWVILGAVGGEAMSIRGLVDLPVSEIATAWRGGLPRAIGV